MNHHVYTVHAYRWGQRDWDSYTVGVYSTPDKALQAAETEEQYRGGKYECEVLEWPIDTGQAGTTEKIATVIKPLEHDDQFPLPSDATPT